MKQHIAILGIFASLLFAGTDSTVTVHFTDGTERSGHLVYMDSNRVEIALHSDSSASAPLRVDGRSRYLYAPSSFNLDAGKMQFSQKELLFSTFAYGLTDNVSLQVGSVIPALFVSGGRNGLLGIKAGGMWHDRLGAHAGMQTFFFEKSTLLVPFAGVTGAQGPGQVSFNYAQGSTTENLHERISIYDLAGAYRIMPSLSLVSENFLVFPPSASTGNSDKYLWIASLVARYHGPVMVLDAGFLKVQDLQIPIPWVDFSFQF